MTFLKDAASQLSTFGHLVSSSFMSNFDALHKPRLKVALISYYYEQPTQSGVGIHMYNLAMHLVKLNCEVHVFCIGKNSAVYRENGVIVHPIERVLITGLGEVSKKRLTYDLFESEVIKELLRESRNTPFDVIHTHGALVKSAFILKKICNIKWVHTFHAVEKMRMNELSAEEKEFADFITWMEHTVSYTDGAIFVSQNLLKEGAKQYSLKSKVVIPNGVNREMYSYTPISKKNVLFVGRFSEEKGIHHLPAIIEATMRIQDATFTAVCPSNALGTRLRRIREKIARLEKKYPGRLRIIETSVPVSELKQLYDSCQVYIQPSAYESFGLCILEAMSVGRPVVAFNVGGISEVVGDAGYVVSNADALIKKITWLLEHKDESIKMGLRAHKRARQFDWQIVARKVLAYYSKVESGKRT